MTSGSFPLTVTVTTVDDRSYNSTVKPLLGGNDPIARLPEILMSRDPLLSRRFMLRDSLAGLGFLAAAVWTRVGCVGLGVLESIQNRRDVY